MKGLLQMALFHNKEKVSSTMVLTVFYILSGLMLIQ